MNYSQQVLYPHPKPFWLFGLTLQSKQRRNLLTIDSSASAGDRLKHMRSFVEVHVHHPSYRNTAVNWTFYFRRCIFVIACRSGAKCNKKIHTHTHTSGQNVMHFTGHEDHHHLFYTIKHLVLLLWKLLEIEFHCVFKSDAGAYRKMVRRM